MSITLESGLNDALKLPPEDRALLADRLHESLEGSAGVGGDTGFSDPETEKAWMDEVERRSAELGRGEATLLSEEEFRRRRWLGRCDAEWAKEVERRIDQMDRGEVKGVPGDEVLRKLLRGECP